MMKNMQMTALASAAFPKESDAIRLLESMRSASPEESSKAVDDVTVLVESSVLVDGENALKDETLKGLKDEELDATNQKVKGAVDPTAKINDCHYSVQKEKMKRFLERLAELDLENLVLENDEVKAIVKALRLTDSFEDAMIAKAVEKKRLEKKIIESKAKLAFWKWNEQHAADEFENSHGTHRTYAQRLASAEAAKAAARKPMLDLSAKAVHDYFHGSRSLHMTKAILKACGNDVKDHAEDDTPSSLVMEADAHLKSDKRVGRVPSILEAFVLAEAKEAKTHWEEAKKNNPLVKLCEKDPLVKLCRVAQQCLECKSYDKDVWRKKLVIKTICNFDESSLSDESPLVFWAAMSSPEILEACLIVNPNISEHLSKSLYFAAKRYSAANIECLLNSDNNPSKTLLENAAKFAEEQDGKPSSAATTLRNHQKK